MSDYDQINEFADEITKNPTSGQIIDCRSEDRFFGKVPEPREGLRSGHIKGSKCVSFDKFLRDDFTLKSAEELKVILEREEIDLEDNLRFTCGSGVSASVGYLACFLAGKRYNLSLYDGAWSEYGSKPDPFSK